MPDRQSSPETVQPQPNPPGPNQPDPGPPRTSPQPGVPPGPCDPAAQPPPRPRRMRTLREFGVTSIPATKTNIHSLVIIGQVEGHMILPNQNKTTKYEHILPQLVALEQHPEIEGVVLILNTVGGDVEAGLAMAEMISSLSKPTVSLVLGGGHSIGVPIAVAADYSYIAETASMTIHPIRITGQILTVPQTFEYLEKMQDRVVRFVVKHSRIQDQTFRELMFRTGELARDIGTVLIGREAVDCGLIDAVGGIEDVMATLRRMIAERKAGRGAPAG